MGIDIPTDGEFYRENYIFYHLRNVTGVDFINLEEVESRGGNYKTKVPVVREQIKSVKPYLTWLFNEFKTTSPLLKMTLPGPLTIEDSIKNV